jgi:release factor glutamine methyltransferase
MFAPRRQGYEAAMRLFAPPGVFSPRSDTWLLAERLRREPALRGGSVLDLCTGTGALAIAAALEGAGEVTAVDASRLAVLAARVNARLNGARVRALRGDLFAPLGDERFDVIVSNPPYVPAGADNPKLQRPRRAYYGGHDGRALIDRVCAGLPAHLRPGGVALLVQSSVCGEHETLRALHAGGLRAEVVERRRGPLGPLMRARAPELRRRGLLPPDGDEEELLVFRGRAA